MRSIPVCSMQECQFEVIKDRLPLGSKVDEKYYCIFHLPVSEKSTWNAELNKRFADSLKIAVENNITNLNHVIFPKNTSVHIPQPPNGKNLELVKLKFMDGAQIIFYGSERLFKFDNCEFHGNIRINIGNSGCSIIVNKTKFKGKLWIIKPNEYLRLLDLSECEFFDKLDLHGIHVAEKFICRGVRYHVCPNYESMSIPQYIDFDNVIFEKTSFTKDAESSFRHMRLELSKKDARDYEGAFYQYEQRCTRKRYPKGVVRSFSWLYDQVSAYGTTFYRPFKILLFGQVSAFFIYFGMWLSWNSVSSLTSRTLEDISIFTAAQLFKPFEIFSYSVKSSDLFMIYGKNAHLGYLYLFTPIHTLLSYVIFALFILALRWRFRRTVV